MTLCFGKKKSRKWINYKAAEKNFGSYKKTALGWDVKEFPAHILFQFLFATEVPIGKSQTKWATGNLQGQTGRLGRGSRAMYLYRPGKFPGC